MIGLLRSEVRRLLSRRVGRILLGLVVLIILVVEVRVFAVSSRDVEAARRRAAAEAARNADEFARDADRSRVMCESAKARGEIPPDVSCEQLDDFQPTAEAYYRDPRLNAKDALHGGVVAVTIVALLVAFSVGASFVGAEWHAGTMQALLFWEPRRGRVLLAKALAFVAVSAAVTLLLQGLVYGLTSATAATRGTFDGVTSGVHTANVLTMLRGLLVVVISGLFGFAIAGLARLTAAAVGVAFVYLVGFELIIGNLRPGYQRFLFVPNVHAIIDKQVRMLVPQRGGGPFSDFARPFVLTGERATLTLGLYLAIVLGAFYVSFTRRDVT